jgi:hypothetical protein
MADDYPRLRLRGVPEVQVLRLGGSPRPRRQLLARYETLVLPRFVSLLTATLPIEYLEVHGPGRVRQLALDMASNLLFASGHAGLASVLPPCVPGCTQPR